MDYNHNTPIDHTHQCLLCERDIAHTPQNERMPPPEDWGTFLCTDCLADHFAGVGNMI